MDVSVFKRLCESGDTGSGRSDITFSYRVSEATRSQSQSAERQQQLVRRENYSQAHIADAWQGGATAVLQ
jgi:hypothetical protein